MILTRTPNFDDIYGLAKSTADDSFAAMKALVAFIAIAAVSVAGAGFYYVTSTSNKVLYEANSESECSASKEECLPLTEECGLKAPCDEAAKPDCGAKECTDQKKAEDQNPT